MAPPNKIILPNADPQADILRRLLALETTGGTVQLRPYTWDVDAAHPALLDFVIGKGAQPAVARLSFMFRPFRTTSSFAGGTTGADASGESGHTHSHAHNLGIGGGVGGTAIQLFGTAGPLEGAGGPFTDTNTVATNAAASSGHAHSHSHSVAASSLGISEGASTTISTLLVDGVDRTSVLGGPWLVAKVNLDVAKYLPLGDDAFHTITLTPAGQGRIVAEFSLA